MPNRPRCTQVLVALCFWVTTAGTLAAQAPPVPEDSAAFATIARYLKSQYSSKNLTIVVTPYRIMDLALAIEDKLEEEQVNERLLDSRRKVLSDLRILLTSKRMPSKCLGALVPRAYPTDELCPRTDSVAVLVGLAHSRG